MMRGPIDVSDLISCESSLSESARADLLQLDNAAWDARITLEDCRRRYFDAIDALRMAEHRLDRRRRAVIEDLTHGR